ncbi:glycerophosphodiester phosphodiesterase [Evansella halocellulosilytica]|uniref:glycerophosphodiester phosphodiesterase n=1 Tax=Evansella halocellulosilytica TaxID=2011013 RepID=UPI000BB85F84|nr:glycerophosphodiester phosphodiesterase [Evansella halocellulosilytica]
MKRKTLIFGHRGSSGRHPENTMDSFEAALQEGADGLEIDVQLSEDDVPVVIHDETVDRTTNGTGWVKDFTFDELQKLDAGSWFSSTFSGAMIPSLEELFRWLVNTPLLLNIEIKSGLVRYPNIEKIVLDLIEKYDLNERVIISSFNHYSLAKVHKLNNEIETAILFMEGLYEPWNYAKTVGAQSLHCYYPVAAPELIRGAAQANMPIRPFTVNEASHLHALMSRGCDAVITDYPKKAVDVRNTLFN